MNSYNAIGHVGKPPETKHLPDGTQLASTSFAVNDGTAAKPHTSWFTIKAFGKTAEFVANLAQGQKIGVTGRVKVETYEKREGGKGVDVQIIASEVTYCTPKNQDAAQSQARTQPATPAGSPDSNPGADGEDDGDLPF